MRVKAWCQKSDTSVFPTWTFGLFLQRRFNVFAGRSRCGSFWPLHNVSTRWCLVCVLTWVCAGQNETMCIFSMLIAILFCASTPFLAAKSPSSTQCTSHHPTHKFGLAGDRLGKRERLSTCRAENWASRSQQQASHPLSESLKSAHAGLIRRV